MNSISRQPWWLCASRRVTSLVAFFLLVGPASFAQSNSNSRPSSADAAAGIATSPAGAEETITLSPFEVRSSQEHGYFSPTTLAGTRLNNNIADLPSSISIVTRQELLDTNSQNINDVFRFASNAEGASTYTPITLVRGSVADVLGNAPQTSGNRVRGLATADLEVDNYFSISRIPFDSYNTQSLEVDRGPNSILFGTGSPAGIVNQTRTRASLNKFSGDASIQFGRWGTFRETASINVPVWRDKLAINVAQAYTSRGFQQEPSSDITRRQYAAITFDPFKSHKTKINASFENYNNSANDPNVITPVDFVTPWLKSGRPVYNPLNNMVTYLDTGKTDGPYALSKTSPDYAGILQSDLTTTTSPHFVPSLSYAGLHLIQLVEPDNSVSGFFKQQQTGFTLPGWVPSTLTPAQARVNEEKMTWSAPLPTPAGYQIWQVPGVTSKSIYDWSSINLNAMSRAQTAARTYYVDVQQELLPNLNLDLGWFRQEFHQYTDQPLSQSNATTLYVDTNSYLLDGRPNLHVGQPFVDTYASDLFTSKEINSNFRASLEYELNLADKVPDWAKWLGHHRFMVVASRHDDVQTNLRYRESVIGGDPNYLPNAATLAASSGYGYPLHNTALEQWMYLRGTGNPDGRGVSPPASLARPSYIDRSTGSIETYNYATGRWNNSTLEMQSILYPSGGLQENLQNSRTYFWQSFFWNDRIVGTFGIDDERIKNRQTVFPSTTPEKIEYNAYGLPNYDYWYKYGPWTFVNGKTRTKGLVFHPLKNWERIDSSANSGNWLAALGRTVSLTYNESGNFNPPPAYYTDFFGNPLEKPHGTERDYGFEISTPDNKLFLRATWFKTENLNQLVGNTSNARALYIDSVELKNWATAVVQVRNGQNPSDPNFGNTVVYPITSAMQTQISQLMGLPYTFGGNVGEKGQFINPYETQNGVAKGLEIEATYNPTPNWRMKLSWGQQKTVLSDIANQAAAWINYRQPTWSTYKAADLQQVYTRSNGRAMYLGDFWSGYGYDGNIYQDNVFGWTNTQNYYNIVVAGQLATDRALNNTRATNQREYTWNYVTSYDFTQGALNGFTFGGAVHYLGRALAGYYGDTQNLSPSGLIYQPDINRPIYYPREWHFDAWIAYKFSLPWDHRLHAQVQLNVTDINMRSHLMPVTYNYDGTPATFRIVQPRTFALTTRIAF